MSSIAQNSPGKVALLMGNEAIARGGLEAGVKVCAAYPGNPSSEIIGSLARVAEELGLHVEWSINEKVALEVAAAASLAGLRGLCAMKQNGLNVASDFLLNLNLTGCRGGLVVVVADDPAGISSSNEEDSRIFAKLGDLPLLEPASFQEAKEMTREAFDLSEKLGLPVMIRSVTRVSHARGNVTLDELPQSSPKPGFDLSRPCLAFPAVTNHKILHEKLKRAKEIFAESPFNFYRGPEKPDLMVITSGSGYMYSLEAVMNLKVEGRVGILKLGTTWPLPEVFLLRHLQKSENFLFIEEVDPFLENNVKELFAQNCFDLGVKRFFGKPSHTVPDVGELNPEIVTSAIQALLNIRYIPRPEDYSRRAHEAAAGLVPPRTHSFCAGCPHRATYWAIKMALALDGRDGFVSGDIGCYSLGMGPSGFFQMKTLHAMGSGTGMACGFGQLERFGMEQPVVAVCGDSTFYHAAMPALANAYYNGANFLLLLLDNSATAMTGFQPHPGTGSTATGGTAPVIDLKAICEVLGARVEMVDPFDIEEAVETILRLIRMERGVKVLILKRECALVSGKRQKKLFQVEVDQGRCLGEACGCNRLCTRIFKCPGLMWDQTAGKAQIDEAICNGCGVCAGICPALAIRKVENGKVLVLK
ncbi:MAG: thiamine pyrophosphate-dependent enzyme [Thermodesulfobacteriota bacterium]|nr:thiamine pyrophosphate-dependent enzyme [Thermodesulfobacteriota bacterium]